MDRECMNAAREFGCEQLIYHAVAFQPGLSFEGIRHNINAEMCLSARPVPGMALMPRGIVDHLKARRRKGVGQFLLNGVLHPHG